MSAGIGYTLATGHLFCDFAEFQEWCERLLDRPILTHEFAEETLWQELRQAFESQVTAAAQAGAEDPAKLKNGARSSKS